MAYPSLIGDPQMLKTKTKDDQLRELQYKTENHDYENILNYLKIDSEYYKKEYENFE